MIRVDDLTRTYGAFTAVDRVSFAIGQGEIVGLLGHNGAGKTTIMKMLTGFLEPSSGSMEIDGIDPAARPLEVRKKIGYLPENCPVYPEMSVIDYLDYAACLHGLDKSERAHRLDEVIERTGLADRALQPIATLSRGFRQRVGVAQAILHRPAILILDEPTNGLDPSQIRQMRELIRDLAGQATVIISTHILQEVQAVCSRVMIISRGRKALDRRLDELQQHRQLQVATDMTGEELQQVLEPLACIKTVTPQSGKGPEARYSLELTGSREPGEAAALAARAIQDSGHRLFELCPQQQSLEALFAEITSSQGRSES